MKSDQLTCQQFIPNNLFSFRNLFLVSLIIQIIFNNILTNLKVKKFCFNNFVNVFIIQMQAVKLQDKQLISQELFQEDDMELMTANLLKIKREITQRNDNQNDFISSIQRQSLDKLKNNSMNATRTSEISDQIRQKYMQFLRHAKLPTNHQQKLSYLLQTQTMSLGIAVALFEMLFYFRDVISEQILLQITEKVFKKIKREKITIAQKYAYFELIAICGVYSQDIIGYVVEQMLEGRLEFQLSFVVLTNMGYKGFQLLINLAKQDFKDIPNLILNHLSKTQQIIKQLLVPSLVEDLVSTKNKGREKDIILSILNRLNQSISTHPSIYGILAEMMQNNLNDRGFIASVLRSSGPQGQKILLQFLSQYSSNQKIMLPIVSVLPWRAQSSPVLRIKVIQYTLGSNFLPGTLYQYEGNVQPSAFNFQQDDCYDSLCVSARDFLAALNRLLTFKLENYQNQELIRKGGINNIKLFALYDVIQKKEQAITQISAQVIKALIKCLSNPKAQIREAAINSLGLIGLPEGFQSIQQVTKCLWDKDSRNRSMACWAISKLCQSPHKKLIQRLIQLLKDSFWKVRISACICLGSIVNEPYENVLEALVKSLKDNSINKVTVCETIMKIKDVGQQILLEILKNANQNDFKIKEAIIYALRMSDVKNPHIDFVLQQIFKHCKGNRPETRINCLQTLNFLRNKASQQGENIVYLKAKTILPFYYYFLEDQNSKIREMATQSIFSFGGQAQLIFIEGIAKGSQMVRIQSAKGLAKLGIQNFRALILGLRDEDTQVRQTTTSAILNNFSAEDVSTFYSSKTQQVPSLLCNLKDILGGGGLSQKMKHFIKQTIVSLQKVGKNNELNQEMKSSFVFEQYRKR